MYYDKQPNTEKFTKQDSIFLTIGLALAIGLLVSILFGAWWGYKTMSVWSASKAGQAQLAKADWNRQIAVKEAKAKMESAKLLAQADIARAKGVAKSNKIIGQSLNHNESYLTWLWIDSIKETKNQIIYVPTEASLPVLEASRMKQISK